MLMAGLAGCGCSCCEWQEWKDFLFLFCYRTINEEDCIKKRKEKKTPDVDSGWKTHKTIDKII